MGHDIHEPIRHTNQSNAKEKRSILGCSTIFFVIALLIAGSGIVIVIYDPATLGVTLLSFVIAGALGLFAYFLFGGLQYEDEYEYRFELNDEGIVEEHINHKNDTKEELHIPFSSMKSVVVGNYARFITHEVKDFYRFSALMIINHEDGVYFQWFDSLDDLKNWLPRFLDKDCPLYKTDADLHPAMQDTADYQVDFSKLQGDPWNGKTDFPWVGMDRTNNPFEPWEHGADLRPQNIEKQEKERKNKTRTWENRTSWLLVLFSLFVGGVVLPLTPLESNNFVELDGTIILEMLFIALVIPPLVVFWQTYTRWYMPFIYFALVTAGNTAAMCVAILITSESIMGDIKIHFSNILLLNILFLLPGWFILLLVIKGMKAIIGFYRDFYEQ